MLAELPVEALLRRLDEIPEPVRSSIRNSGGGFVNHNLFWASMTTTPPTQLPRVLFDALTKQFGSFPEFRAQLLGSAAKIFGSGWTWLCVDPMQANALAIVNTQNQDSPLSVGLVPIFGVDVWEHAYYLRYQNRRLDYLEAWFQVVDWAAAQERYLAALGPVEPAKPEL
eukprot:gnl/Hemi2/1916_TR682_c0_g1_i1.p2 gnl/Hemi2/1916_TR682_c0_g1~~gnl/Hemi2/1916_TR682_c0_g1_i1.p2  ORF type:complete len:169 (+),score=43.81 gnl/Hemi2/1916_TR682_c0_g1_i1:295-801(+)